MAREPDINTTQHRLETIEALLDGFLQRQAELDRRLTNLELGGRVAQAAPDRPASLAGPTPTTQLPSPTTQLPPPPAPPAPRPPSAPVDEPGSDPISIESILRWSGVVLVAAAAIFFVSTAIERGWIGPHLQLTGASLGGLALLVGGVRLADRPGWSTALGSGGAIVVAACASAAHSWLGLVGANLAIGLTAVATIVSLAAITKTGNRSSAVVAGLAASWVPASLDVLADGSELLVLLWLITVIAGFSYLGLRGLLGLAPSRSVRLLPAWLGALMITLLIHAEIRSSGVDEVEFAMTLAALFGAIIVAAVLWLGPWAAELAANHPTNHPTKNLPDTSGDGEIPDATERAIDLRSVLALPVWTWASTTVLLGSPSVGSGIDALVLAVLFGVAIIAGWVATGSTAHLPGITRPLSNELFVAQLLGASVLLSIGFVTQFGSHTTLATVASQGAGLATLGWWIKARWVRYNGYGLVAICALVATTFVVDTTMDDRFDLGLVVASGVVVATAWIVTVVARLAEAGDEQLDGVHRPIAAGSWVATLGWLSSILIHGPQPQASISLMLVVASALAIVVGLVRDDAGVRWLGGATLLVTLVKLFTIDLAAIDTFWRVGLFLVLGLGLMRLGLYLPRLAESTRAAHGAGD